MKLGFFAQIRSIMVGCSERIPRPVFVETNLGTRFAAVPASPDIAAMDFKRELESTHLSCFPEFGPIKVTALMVKHKSRFYRLSESLPLKCAFLDSNRSWFLQMDVVLQPSNSTKPRADKKRIQRRRKKASFVKFTFLKIPTFLRVQKSKRKGKKGKHETEVSWTEKGNTSETLETFSESVSVSRIIKTYFQDDSDEVVSTPFSTVETRHENKCCSNREKRAKPEVGKRILLAQDNMRLTPGHLGASLFLCRDRLEKSPLCESADLVRNLVFEITSEESE